MKQLGTLNELNLKDGDVVKLISRPLHNDGCQYPSIFLEWDVLDGRVYGIPVCNQASKGKWEVVSRKEESPVRRVTKTEILPGHYGGVYISHSKSDEVRLALHLRWHTAPELRRAISTLTEIADALDQE